MDDAILGLHSVLAFLSECCPHPVGRLPTCYSPVRHSHHQTKAQWIPFDLHVLSTPPAFVLSQDQTLRKNLVFFRYASLQLRVASSAHMSALPGRRFAAPRLAQKSLRFTKLDLFPLCCVTASLRVLDVHEYVCGTPLRRSLPSEKISAFFTRSDCGIITVELVKITFQVYREP